MGKFNDQTKRSLNDNAFGTPEACMLLANELNKSTDRVRKKLTTHLANFNKGLNNLDEISDYSARLCFGKLWYKESKTKTVEKTASLDTFIQTLALNVLHYNYATWYRTQDHKAHILARQAGK